MCVGFPMTDMELEVADEDEVYNLQVRWRGGLGHSSLCLGGRGGCFALAANSAGGALKCWAGCVEFCWVSVGPRPLGQLSGDVRSSSPLPQFGRFFEEQALDPNAETVVRDDFAIELALLDE